jgi:hypothetical protein
MVTYTVIVGNIGTVLTTTDKAAACRTFTRYERQSRSGVGRAGGESVFIMQDGEPVFEHLGTVDQETWGEKQA